MQQEEQSGGVAMCGHSMCCQNHIDTGEEHCVAAAVELTINIRIYDPIAFAHEARRHAIKAGIDSAEAEQTYTDADLAACARVLFDSRETVPNGCDVEDSTAVELDVP